VQIRTFLADSMPDALAMVRDELGSDALLLKTCMRKRGTTRQVELTAAKDALGIPRSSPALDVEHQAWSAMSALLSRAQARIRGLETGDPETRWLAACDVAPDLAARLLGNARDKEDRRSSIIADLVGRIRIAHGLLPLPDQPRRIAFVGPAGAGKTTALVKTAAQACASGRRDLALVNLDCYKPGAEDYLAQVGETLHIPVLSERSPDVQAGLVDAEGLLLIDTDSHIHAGDQGSAASRTTLAHLKPDVIALVLPATWRTVDLTATLARYELCGPTHLIFSGLDLTLRYGGILSAAAISGLPVAAVLTTGRFESGLRVFRPELLLQQMNAFFPTPPLPEDEADD
jgi:flagellar biosynthesis protein FlhF